MTSSTTPSPTVSRPPDTPITRAEFDELWRTLTGVNKRAIRTETRVMRLLQAHGLDGNGKPLKQEETA